MITRDEMQQANNEADDIETEDTDKNEEEELQDECIDSEKLEREKSEINKLNAENISAQNQTVIQSMRDSSITNNYYIQKDDVRIAKKTADKRYDLRDTKECINFVEKYADTEYFYTAFVLCVFDTVMLSDVSDIEEKLMNCLTASALDAENEHETGESNRCFIALDSILDTIGAKKYQVTEEKLGIGFEKGRRDILLIILEQFPIMRKVLVSFLKEIGDDTRYSISFYSWQLASTISEMHSKKMINILDDLLPAFCQNTENAYLLGELLYKLYSTGNENDANIIIDIWISSGNTWLWRAVYLTYAFMEENGRKAPFEIKMKKLFSKQIYYLNTEEIGYVSEILMQSVHFRTMVCEVFGEKYSRAQNTKKKRQVSQIYLNLIRQCYYRVDNYWMELPLVVCDTLRQQECLVEILEQIVLEYRLRKQWYAILKAYLKEIAQYQIPEKAEKHLAAYLYMGTLVGPDFREEIQDFLQGCQGKVAKRLIDLI